MFTTGQILFSNGTAAYGAHLRFEVLECSEKKALVKCVFNSAKEGWQVGECYPLKPIWPDNSSGWNYSGNQSMPWDIFDSKTGEIDHYR